ncbi:MAG: hypothetical protein APR62_00885 [Smithella sp. SDB]|nr:MAG: hypothetical protein APR62_00885 [Smithella sp. SDB]
MFIASLLITLIFTVYWQVTNHDFISLDDAAYVTDNDLVKGGLTAKGITEAFTTTQACNWHPLTWISHMIDFGFFGLNPGMHHLVNLIFHTLNSLLLFCILQQLTGATWRSAAVAVLFAIHPLHVESVAWIAERKDVLSTFFWMLTIMGYIRYTRFKSFKTYFIMLLCYILGLLSKPMLVTLPFALLLLDFWPLNRWNIFLKETEIKFISGNCVSLKEQRARLINLFIEKIPLFLLAFISCGITLYAQRGAIKSLDLSLITRISNAVNSYVIYLIKTMWPFDLALFYPFYYINPLCAILCALILCLISLSVLAVIKRLPYLTVGWFWYLGTLIPVIGIVQIGGQSMADRYTYIPFIGIFIMIAWSFTDLIERWRLSRTTLWIPFAVVLILLSARTHDQIGLWKDSETLCRHALKINYDNYVAHCDLALALKKKGDVDGAIMHYKEVLRLNPENCVANNNLGTLLSQTGQKDEGIQHLLTALKVNPHLADTYYNLGIVYYQSGNSRKAMEYFQKALQEKPGHTGAVEGINASLKNLQETEK